MRKTLLQKTFSHLAKQKYVANANADEDVDHAGGKADSIISVKTRQL